MFLRQLSSLLPRSHPALWRSSGASSSSSSSSSPLARFIPAPHPWWRVRGFPPWPLRDPRRLLSGRTLHSQRSFCASARLLMERADRQREPPHKRRRSEEEEEEERGGAAGTTGRNAKDGGSKREHRHPGPGVDGSPRPTHHGGGKSGAAKRVGRETSRDKDGERTKTGNKDKHQQDGRTESWTRGPKSPPGQTHVPAHKPKPNPNPWLQQEQGGAHRSGKGPEEQPRGGSGDGAPWAGLNARPRPPNPWQVAGAGREPPPPGTSPPVIRQDAAPPARTLRRRWETSPAARPRPPGDGAAFDFSVMSYNILSQELLQDNVYLYRHCHPSVLPWEHRLPNLLEEIRQHDADILCLQEVQENHYETQLKPALQALGYQCEYKKRTGRKPDGCAVVFKSSRLSLVSSHPVEFFRRGDALLDRDNVGLVLLLRPVGRSDPSASVCVANTHLLYNPRRGDIKLAQLAILLAEVGRLSRLPDGSTNPVVLCGDLNSTPWSPLYSFLTRGHLDYEGMQIGLVSGQEKVPRGQRLLTSPIWSRGLGISRRCQYEATPPPADGPPSSPTAVEGAISNLSVDDLATKSAAGASGSSRIEHGLKLQSSYQHRLKPDGRPEVTTCHSRTAMTVDYILFTPELQASPSRPGGGGGGLQLLGRLSLVGQSELEEVNCLPNWRHSSDHLPLLARFRFQR